MFTRSEIIQAQISAKIEGRRNINEVNTEVASRPILPLAYVFIILAIGIGGAVARSPLPHHPTCGSASGGSEGYASPTDSRRRPRESK